MIDQKKVRTQTREVLFEEKEGRNAVRLKNYIEDLPPYKSMGRNALAGIMLYLMVMILVVLGNDTWFVELGERAGLLGIILLVVITMAIFAIGYVLLADYILRKQYRKVRSSLSRYRSRFIRIEKMGTESNENEAINVSEE